MRFRSLASAKTFDRYARSALLHISADDSDLSKGSSCWCLVARGRSMRQA